MKSLAYTIITLEIKRIVAIHALKKNLVNLEPLSIYKKPAA